MRLKAEKIKRTYFILDEDDEVLGPVTHECKKILKWMEDKGLWKDGELVDIAIKFPVIPNGVMVYHKEDPDKTPYRWKVWDDKERIIEDYEFCNQEDSVYQFKIKKPWEWTEK